MTFMLPRSHLLHSIFLLCLLVLVGLAPPLAAQQEPAGRVTVVLGSVEAESADGDRRPLGRGDAVFEGDTLHSGPRGRAQIRFNDGGMMSLRPDSVLSLDSYQNSAASPASSRQEMSLRRGGFRAQTGRVAQANRQGYRVQTPVAVIGVRGTVFDAHQEVGGALLVGTSQGGIEVETSAGVIGRIGAGESFDYLRVNPDGSIDFLLEVPEAFTVSPELTAGGEGEDLDAGGVEQSSVNTGDGASESTAGIVTGSGDQLVDVTNDPERSGTISPSRAGSGAQPTTGTPGVLDDGQIETLLSDDRIGVALGVPPVTVGADGEIVIGSPTLQGGIATFNSPLLALSSARAGFGAGLESSVRSDLLAEADLLLLPDSAESESEQNVAGVPGLIWGRYLAPVSLFFDPSDRSRVLEVERDILFTIGTPAEIATLEGQRQFTVTNFEAVSSGLAVNEIAGGGTLDVTNARYIGFLDILFGADAATEASLFAEFAGDVEGGVLEGLEFGSFDLFDFETESSVAAEGELAGFFTGEAATFLQLAFDFRVPSRDDADVAGLVLLAEVEQVTGGAPTAEEFFALQEDRFFVAASCCFLDDGRPTRAFAGRATDPALAAGEDAILAYSVDESGVPIAANDPRFAAALPDRTVRREGAEVAFFDEDPEAGLAAFEWQGSQDSMRIYDSVEGDELGQFTQNLMVLTGQPTRVADLTGFLRYEAVDLVQGLFLSESGAIESTPLPFAEMSFNVDFADGRVTDGFFRAPLEANIDAPPLDAPPLDGSLEGPPQQGGDGGFFGPTMVAIFEGQVTTDGEHAFVSFDVQDGGIAGEGDDPLNLEASFIEGFFSGESAERFAAAFHLQTQGTFVGPVLAVGNVLLEQRPLSLSTLDQQLFVEAPLGYVAAGTGLGAVGEAILDGDRVLFGFNATGPGGDDFLATPPTQLLRQAGASSDLFQTGQFDALVLEPIRQGVWFGEASSPLRVSADDGEILERIGDFFFFQLALPLDPATLQAEGFTTFAGSSSSVGDGMLPADAFGVASDGGFMAGANASFNVDLASGEIHAGHLFVLETAEQVGDSPLVEESGFRVFFDGNIDYGADEGFVALNLTGGEHLGGQPLDLEASSMEAFFSGGEDGLVMLGNYRLTTALAEGEDPVLAAGVFSIANVFEEEPGSFVGAEQRLAQAEVEAWDRLGIATFASDPFFPAPGDGVIMGRAGPVNLDDPFVLGADAPRVFEDGAVIGNTRRSDFLAQPFEFVLRRGLAQVQTGRFDADARPAGAPSFAGFKVSWGAWDDPGSGSTPFVQDDPRDPQSQRQVGSLAEVFFASVNPTPTAQLPRTGSVSFGGDAAFIGGGGGSLSGFGRSEVDALATSFDLDFASGAISNGAIEVNYEGFSGTAVRWTGEFDGFLNGPITDLTVNALTVEAGSSGGFGPPAAADLDHSNLSGVLTGPAGERHLGGFSFVYEDGATEALETVEGLWVIDQVQGGPN